MTLYWKALAGVLLAVVLILTLRRQELGLVLGITVCTMAALAAAAYLEPVMDLVNTMQELGGLDEKLLKILMKAVGIGLLTEIAGMVCADSGNSSLGKAMQLLGTAVILWLSVPLFSALMEMIREILEGL